MRICEVESCEQRHKAKGFCSSHYRQMRLTDPEVLARKREQDRGWSRRNRDRKKEYYRRWRDRQLALVHDAKLAGCADCGLTPDGIAQTAGVSLHQAMSVFDFDHLPGFEKEATISEIVRSGGLERLAEEITKCEVVCSNCHRLRWFRKEGQDAELRVN